MAELLPGSHFAGYLIEGLIGRGGMGVVYRAWDTQRRRAVALKVIAEELAEDSRFRERFDREARAVASLDHPHVVPIFDADQDNGRPYLAMRLVEGKDLGAFIKRERVLLPSLAVRLVGQIASALDAGHAIGLVHRDVKPANVLVAQSFGEPYAYLTDFGVARRLHQKSTLTGSGMVLGTLDYLAPEALRGEGSGPAADIYALGCLLLEALTGEVPFPRENEVATILAHLNDPPPSLARRVPGIPPALELAVHRALAKDPGERFATASALARAATASLATPDTGQPISVARASRTATVPVAKTREPRRSPPTPTRKRVTLLYTMPSIELPQDPEVRLAASADFTGVVGPILERHGATIQASPTDGIVAVFGLPTLSEDDAARAVRAAVEVHEEFAGPEHATCPTTAIATDVVLAGWNALRATTIAGLLDQALSIREAAASGDILVSEATRVLAGRSARFEPLMDGSAEGPALWRALKPETGWSEEPLPAPLVGRGREFGRLSEVLSRVIDARSSRLVSIIGEPGVGKSRLGGEWAASVQAQATVVTVRCPAPGASDARQPVRDLLAQLFSGERAADPRQLLEGDDAAAIAERVERLLGRREGVVAADELPWAVRRYLAAVARERPLVALFEDIHWAEPVLLELIEHLAEWTADAPLLLLCLARPELLDRRPDWGEGAKDALRVAIEPLSKRDSVALIDGLGDASGLTESMCARIVEVAEGNPLFVEQLVAHAREQPDPADADPVSPNIRALLAARLDQLGEAEHRAASHAAVIGREFSRAALVQLLAGRDPGLTAALRSLARRDLIEPADTGAFRFRHALICDAAYEAVPKTVRAELHERHAAWLETPAGHGLDEAIGFHLEQAYRYRDQLGTDDELARDLGKRAAERLGRAGRRALAFGDMPVAENLLERATVLLGEGNLSRLELQLDLSTALYERGTLERSAQRATEVVEAARLAGYRALELRGLVQHSLLEQFTETDRDLDRAMEVADSAISVLGELGDEAGLAMGWSLRADVEWTRGRFAAGIEALDCAHSHARCAGDRRTENLTSTGLATGMALGPMPAPDAIDRCEQMLTRANVDGRPYVEAAVLVALAQLHAMRGRFAKARELYEKARQLAGELDSILSVAGMTQGGGMVELLAGAPAAAEREFRLGYVQLDEIGEKGLLSTSVALLAEALLRLGRYGEAERCSRLSEEAASADDAFSQVLWRTTKAKVLAQRGRHADALKLVRRAVAVAAGTDALNLRGDASIALADVLILSDSKAEATAALRDAVSHYEAKGNLVSTRAARTKIKRLTRDQPLPRGRARQRPGA